MSKVVKRFMRQVLQIEPSEDKTKRSNPRIYRFLLDCGHTAYEFHGPYTVIRYCVLSTNPDAKIMKHCHECARGKSPCPKCLKQPLLPLGILSMSYCRKQCDENQRTKCMQDFKAWYEQRLDIGGTKKQY